MQETNAKFPPTAYDVNMVGSVVRIGSAGPNQLTRVITGNNDGKTSKRLTYMYEFAANSGEVLGVGTVYQSPILHHLVVDGLVPGQQYFYQVGDNNYGFSKVYNFTMPKLSTSGYPFKIAVAADIGQTANSSDMIHRLGASKPDIFLHEGDYSYSDDWLANGTSQFDRHPAWGPGPDYFTNWQQKWDSWMRMAQDVIASVPHNGIAGNHEIESQRLQNNITNMAYNARFPLPRDPSVINTSPNDVTQYWDQALLPGSGKFFPMSMTDSVRLME